MIAVIICEYNPFHLGHAHHIAETRRLTSADIIICVMSGSFTQRGEAACQDKFTRARHAILAGADCVIELPSLYATSGADYFAYGAAELIRQIRGATHLSFGSECGDIAVLTERERISATPEYHRSIRESVSSGLSYPIASAMAYAVASRQNQSLTESLIADLPSESYQGATNTNISSPNDTLAIAYLRALRQSGSGIIPVVVPRTGNGYHSTDISGGYPSATAIRQLIHSGGILLPVHVPTFALSDANNFRSANLDTLFGMVAARLLSAPSDVYEDNEGLVNRAIRQLNMSNNLSELIDNIHTKRYTKSRITRFICHLLLGHTHSLLSAPLDYMTPLAVRRSMASEILPRLLPSQSASLLLQNDIYADNVYGAICGFHQRDGRLHLV